MKEEIEQELPFTVEILAEYENLGHISNKVHESLDDYRVISDNSREWFSCPYNYIECSIGHILGNAQNEARLTASELADLHM